MAPNLESCISLLLVTSVCQFNLQAALQILTYHNTVPVKSLKYIIYEILNYCMFIAVTSRTQPNKGIDSQKYQNK